MVIVWNSFQLFVPPSVTFLLKGETVETVCCKRKY